MSEAGYTLAETLAALLIIGLAFAGLFDAMHVIGLVQVASVKSVAAATETRTIQSALEQAFARAGPFRSDDENGLTGASRGLRFNCGEAELCGALVSTDASGAHLLLHSEGRDQTRTLAGYRDAWFSYTDASAAYAAWPLGPGKRSYLRAIVLTGRTSAGEQPIATVRLWREQEPNCRFDPIAQDCRVGSP